MRKLLLFGLLAMMLAVPATAQETPIDKGSMVIGGTAFYWSRSGERYEDAAGNAETIISIVPSFGYFMSPGFMVGADLIYTGESQGPLSATYMGIGPMVRYYFNATKERTEIKGATFPYIKAFMLYISEDSDYWGDDKFMSFGGGVGVNYMFSTDVSLDFGIRLSIDSDDDDSGMAISLGAGITGFVY